MARWKARVDFLLTVTELLFLSLTVEALQGKTCPNSLPFGGGGSVWDTFCYLTVQTAPCYVQSLWHNTGVWQTDGIAVASTALAMW